MATEQRSMEAPMMTPVEALALADRMQAMADELIDPLLCRTPAYGAPGHAHCAACCYGLGYIVTCDEEQAMVDASFALQRAAQLIGGQR